MNKTNPAGFEAYRGSTDLAFATPIDVVLEDIKLVTKSNVEIYVSSTLLSVISLILTISTGVVLAHTCIYFSSLHALLPLLIVIIQ
ncbi:hypothetical protein GGR50DRAFT_221136 [Xylaria sp. CBS 124048]|nr:hypothetical protein GGR50DRAFT_221136 [Xylaria sp. CBS 124048]